MTTSNTDSVSLQLKKISKREPDANRIIDDQNVNVGIVKFTAKGFAIIKNLPLNDLLSEIEKAEISLSPSLSGSCLPENKSCQLILPGGSRQGHAFVRVSRSMQSKNKVLQ